MLYAAYQAQADAMAPLRLAARTAAAVLGRRWSGLGDAHPVRAMAAASELLARSTLTHKRPAFGIERVGAGNGETAVREVVVDRTPFCSLLRFERDDIAVRPPVLLVAPMSGHFATLLRETVRTMLVDHDVHITDWHNVRDVGLVHGRFGFDQYVLHLIRFLERLGPDAHILAVCQPSVAALAAVALMAQDGNPCCPRSMTLMAGPIDTRVNPTAVDRFATEHPLDWFERKVIATVPLRFGGALRRVYPGFLQLLGFMSMNLERHLGAFADMFRSLADGEPEKAATIKRFYEEYFAVMDLPAEFYLETIRSVFQDHDLPLGRLTVAGRRVDPAAIRHTALLTVEGERDDICAAGQTVAAQDLCPRIRPYLRRHHVQTGVGHYGVFSGRRWASEIYPVVRDVIHMAG